MIIGFTGKAGSGKDTAANAPSLIERHHYAFADIQQLVAIDNGVEVTDLAITAFNRC